jgi:hypothetical protein
MSLDADASSAFSSLDRTPEDGMWEECGAGTMPPSYS